MASKKTVATPLTNAASWLAMNQTLAILESGAVVGYVYSQVDSAMPRATANVQRWYLKSSYVPPTPGGTPSSFVLQQPSDATWRCTSLSAFQTKVRAAFVTGSDNYIKVDCATAKTTADWATLPKDVGDFPAYPNRIQAASAKKPEKGGRPEPQQLDVGETNLLQGGNVVGTIYATLERDTRSSPNNVLYSHEYAMLKSSYQPASPTVPTTVQAVAAASGGFDGYIDAMNALWGTGCSFVVSSCTWSYGAMLSTF